MNKKIIKISSKNCAPCLAYAPTFDKWVYDQDSIEVVLVDIDDNPAIASKYRVMSVPTTIVVDEDENVLSIKSWILNKKELDEMYKQS